MKKTLLLTAALLLMGGAAQAACADGNGEVIVSVTTDRYGSETTWTLTGPGGSPVYASGGPYSTMSSNGAYPQAPATVCIPYGSAVVFSIYDSYGDGLCCSYGQGTYSVTVDGETAVAYAGFSSSRQVTFQVGPQAENDLAIMGTTLPDMFGAGNIQIKGTVKNFGTTSVSSYAIGYMVDDGDAETATVSTTVSANGQHTFTHPVQWNATSGEHTVKIWVGMPDGSADGYPLNDTLEVAVSVATASVQRTALMEEFTSSTCGPCYQLNVVQGFDQLLSNLNTNEEGSNLAAIKYQMNWPSPGNDPSYNSDGLARRNYYGVQGVPDPYLDGKEMSSFGTSVFNTAKAVPAFASLDVSFTMDGGTTADVTVNATPHYSGSGYRLYVAITEDFYNYPAAYTPQKDYHFAMRKMLPSGSGTVMGTFVADETQTFNFTYTMNEGGPAQGNYNLWGSVDGITIVAFIQKTSTKEIIQAAFANQPLNMSIAEEVAANPLQVWPNPTTGEVQLRYDQAMGTKATVEVFNTIGERVLETQRNFASAGQVETLDLYAMEPGMYLVRLTADGTVSTQRINLVK